MKLKGFLAALLVVTAVFAQAQILDKYVTIGKQMLDQGEVAVAVQSLTEGERVNNINTRYYLGLCYENGWGCQQDLQKSFTFYRKSAESGNDDAKVAVALMLQRGIGTAQNETKAKYWVEKLIMAHKQQGYFLKGMFLIDGAIYKQDVASGLEMVQKAADANNPDACVYLAFKLVESDPSTAASYIDKACSISNNSYLYFDKKGEFLFLLGQQSQARELWQQMITASPAYGIEFNSVFANKMREILPVDAKLRAVYDSSREEKYAQITGNSTNSSTMLVAQQTPTPVAQPSPQRQPAPTSYTPSPVVSNTPIQVSEPSPTNKNDNKVSASVSEEAKQSDVDIDIPKISASNDVTFAVVIANENYQEVDKVPFANHDGEIFSQYCVQTLGLPQSNVHLVKDATLNNIKRELNWLQKVVEAYGNEANVIVYYAGHGIPDESTKKSYILPVDGYGSDVSTGFSLEELYATLGSMGAKSVVVMLDACFSGVSRTGNMVASARGVALVPKKQEVSGNMVVFSASQNDETAYPHKEQNHGLFTYYLLKKLKSTKGQTTLGELCDYITDNVKKTSIVVNGKSQTPTASASASVAQSWRNWLISASNR